MELTETQKQSVQKWANDGCGLSEIQKLLAEEFDIGLTYMDVRFLIMDLGLDIQDKKTSHAADVTGDLLADGPGSPADGVDESQPGAGGVSVAVDPITKPGSVVSGTVMFSDGRAASWMLDQTGRLAIDAGDPNYRPSQPDLQAFQEELRTALSKRGF